MKLRIYNGIATDNKWFFDINNNDYKFVANNQETVDIALVEKTDKTTPVPAKIYVVLDINHGYENQIGDRQWPPNWYHIVHATNTKSYVSPQVVPVDIWFNLVKAYHQRYPMRPGVIRWNYPGASAFNDTDLTNSFEKMFIFLAPNKLHPAPRCVYRSKLVKFLQESFGNYTTGSGFIGNPPESVIHSQSAYPDVPANSQSLFGLGQKEFPGWGYHPIHSSYYFHTFISIYAETIEYGDTILVTEKTYEPLIRGHFILPFSTTNFVQHLKSLGFLFPDFIDYSYDQIEDSDLRYQAYQSEISRLMAFDISTWRKFWDENLDLLYYNQKIFVERPYDRVDFDTLLKSTVC